MSQNLEPHQRGLPPASGLYDPANERDACGIGFVANISGEKTHAIVEKGIEILINLTHRGACGCDPETGDGAGLMIQIPDRFFRRECRQLGFDLPRPGEYAVAMVFLPVEPAPRLACEAVLETVAAQEGLEGLGWRDTPVDGDAIGRVARVSQPYIEQFFVRRPEGMDQDAFERRLYVARKRASNEVRASDIADKEYFYIPSFSSRTIVYKGLLLAPQIAKFYAELTDPDVASAMCLVHQRFSTNTFPTWNLAHPYRFIAHNGEINTLKGNVNWMHARQSVLASPLFGEDIRKLFPIIEPGGSDSACFDNALELLVMAGRSLPHAVAMMIPEAWVHDASMPPERRAFYEFHAGLMEPWDGPAAVAFSDGRVIGATLDRNGLRPARYEITHDGQIVMASETGVLASRPENVRAKGRLQPGRMLLVDLEQGRIVSDDELKDSLARRQPYGEWIARHQIRLEELPEPPHVHPTDHKTLLQRQRAFGYTDEDLKFILVPMAEQAEEPVGSMGYDIPLACLSDKPQRLTDYFRQLFAQVTNPPIDPIREASVMSLVSHIGTERNILEETPQHAHLLKMPQPILTNADLERLRRVSQGDFLATTLPSLYLVEGGAKGLERAIESLCRRASLAIKAGYTVLILSDRGVDEEYAPIPALLAVSAVHNHLVREETRTQVALVVESGEPREVMDFALLIGYGASSVNPYVVFETYEDLEKNGLLPDGLTAKKASENFIKAVGKGLLKTFSKMGISTLQSYKGAQIFEAIGLDREFVERYFTGTPSRIGGVGLEVIHQEAAMKHAMAFERVRSVDLELPIGGKYQFRRGGEPHLLSPEAIAKVQHSVREGSFEKFQEFCRMIDEQNERLMTLRGLLTLKEADQPVPLDEVEPAESIVRRFTTGAMSFGSISREAHEALAIAMNRLGGKSNTGEGGEEEERFHDERRSAIKQVASGRFGVTTNYLVNADELQIKMAQGAKPGEGGQLPGHKVDEVIARVRHSVPGVTLISPPPHHDIYSIEDLAQLIFDLKNANPEARISVKLVSEVGVGTVAAGVAKAHADVVLISGDSGGTGASPLSSIRHAGLPWELGLAETQQVLVQNDLRGRIRVQTDGKLQTGKDVAVAALLGAEEFGFATMPLIALGCVMMRKCHLNTCPVGIATQDPVLRAKFTGHPDHVVNYFFFVAEEVRELMAQLGVRKFDELIGRSDWLDVRAGVDHWKARGLDFSRIFYSPPMPPEVARYHCEAQDHGLERALDHRLMAEAAPALESKRKVEIESPITNRNRSVGAMLSNAVVTRYTHAGLPEDTIHVRFKGVAGQSFGAFLARGITFELEGVTNDYTGKGLSGGRIIVYPDARCPAKPEENIVVGNTVLYGAIEGEVFFRGVAGERFCVRNSGATAVVEGTGDHGCEYMTGGTVVVLGPTGRNFAAGMSGGIAYVYDPQGRFRERCNLAMVALEPLLSEIEQIGVEQELIAQGKGRVRHRDQSDEALVKSLIERHLRYTGSTVALAILDDWERARKHFIKVFPHEYKRALTELYAQRLRESATAREAVAK
ncbi:MAG: glutamate synthase large subunit [Fimbriimonadales bacterium]|nr:glutamate synthase large subunit [Fimbriimonadales bacterium]